MKLPAYPRTKPSGVEWLGDVPEHWSSISLRRISTRYSGGTPDRSNDSFWEDGTIPWINSGAVNQSLITEPSAFITDDAYRNSSAKWVAKGALVMALAGQGKTKGMVAQTGIATTCNQSMAAICPDASTNPRYLYWLLVSEYEHIRNMAGGEARDGLNLEILGSIPCLKVPFAEQQGIAAYLDRETGRLDRLVGRKRELIERLKEKRTALISHTVTRGLPSAAARAAGLPAHPPLKPSGVEWLGDVPEHWSSISLRRISTRYSGGTPDRSNDSFWEDGTIPWINSGAVNQSLITEPSAFITDDAYRNSSAKWVAKGALVMALAGQGKTKGMVAQTGIATTCNQSMAAICPDASTNPRYLYWLLVSEYEHIRNMAGGEARDGLNLEILGSIPCLKVPFAEQQGIAAYLDLETAKLDTLVGKVAAAVERLQEYRTALITAAVTGKIDVRKEGAP